mmetsp:Transcript_3872/g.16676  ORF Transcript_3872/g.16676 Transcript_3872/m.16676 type:complete len:288 (-) Transcript_3872:684-1547(-)|eukprot:CAMPEP_0113963724 /NCGR_PEP_ID=MMETSP0011_2-20120614/6690_1 /TAXON_ID=101924 /ORGANISM="Rhodosorus marinus" /LENGTH=287 /DNA_ID=CAMNT_0000975841 /DNA_START=95 /DNA_END=958 /DNA_ORIENTATION=- /assembly_acc=CAM_ASM_000156
MGERKVLNKYYPPDFDGTKLVRNKRPRDQLELIRFMLPVTVRCNNCGEYMYAGKKFNVKKETLQNEDYLGLKIFRFYVKCVSCSSQFTIKTDPKNADYIAEAGATRNFEPWRQQEQAEDDVKKALDEEEMDTMAALENRTLDAKEEMEIQDALDQLRHLRAQQGHLSFDQLLRIQQRRFMNTSRIEDARREKAELEDEKVAKEVFQKRRNIVKRLEDPSEEDENKNAEPEPKIRDPASENPPPPQKPKLGGVGRLNIKISTAKKLKPATESKVALASLAAYPDSDDE